MKDLINYLELKVIEYKKECKSLEVLEAEKALKEARESFVFIKLIGAEAILSDKSNSFGEIKQLIGELQSQCNEVSLEFESLRDRMYQIDGESQ